MVLRRRWLLALLVGLLLWAVVVLGVVHLPAVQRWAWDRVTHAVHESTGWVLTAEGVRLRGWPARLEVRGLEARSQGRLVGSVAVLQGSWRWREVAGSVPRIERISVDRVRFDLRELPAAAGGERRAPGPAVTEMLRAVEVGLLEVRDSTVDGGVGDLGLEVRQIRVTGSLHGGAAAAELHAAEAAADRFGRVLTVGPLDVRVRADGSGVVVDRLVARGDQLRIDASGTIAFDATTRVDLELDADLGGLVSWWDPNLGSGFHPAGRAAIRGTVATTGSGGLEYALRHVGPPLRISGYQIAGLGIEGSESGLRLEVAGPDWGRAVVSVADEGAITLDATLERADIGPVLALAAPTAAASVPAPLLASGTVALRFTFPVSLAELAADVDVEMTLPGGRIAVQGTGAGAEWNLERIAAEVSGASLVASGRLASGGGLTGSGKLEVDEPERLVRALAGWGVDLGDLGVEGGPLSGWLSLTGSFADPRMEVELAWVRPVILGVELSEVGVSASADRAAAHWRTRVEAVEGVEIRSTGATDLVDLLTEGEWELRVDSAWRLHDIGVVDLPRELSGEASGAGTFRWTPDHWEVAGQLRGRDLGVGEWAADDICLTFSTDGGELEVEDLLVHALGGALEGGGRLGLAGTDGALDLSLTWAGIDPALLPAEAAQVARGRMRGSLVASGTVASPDAVLQIQWEGGAEAAAVGEVGIAATLENGEIQLLVERVATAAGELSGSGSVPLGDLPRPPWLWPDAPRGPARVRVSAAGARSGPLIEALGLAPLPIDLTCDVEADVLWDLIDPTHRVVLLTLRGAELDNRIEPLTAVGDVEVSFAGGVLEVMPFELAGERSRIRAGGRWLMERSEVAARVDATLSPEVVGLVPLPLRARGPIEVEAEVEGPLSDPVGRLAVDHAGGEIVLRDPALELRDLKLAAIIAEGAVWIEDGSATMNRGQVLLGGGWDPVSGQGLVFEFDNVIVLLPMSILTNWSGQVAIEPDPDRLARVVGELALQGGIWDRPVNLAETLLGAESLAPAADDPLQRIALDLELRGRGGIQVENNLGDFDVGWSTLQVTGTAAQPVLRGDIRLEPGGTVNLPGRTVTIRRAQAVFTGNPATDPILEIVPEEDILTLGEGQSLDAGMLAAQSLARGIGTALGFENETLQPAEVGVETETDSSSRFTIGQRLSRNVALFFSSDLGDVQDQTTMLQLWNVRGLKGLALQGYTKTGADESGVNLIQKFRWGGSPTIEDRPTIQKIRFEGEWPLGSRRLRKASGLRKGEPFEPFLLFAAGLRLERELAGDGYQLARVDGRAEGDERLPTVVFTCEQGPRQTVEFTGVDPPKQVRQEVVSLYQRPPLEAASLEMMATALRRHFSAEGYPEASVEISRSGDAIVATIGRGPERRLEGPVAAGVPESIMDPIRALVGTPTELDALRDNPDRGARVVERLLHGRGFLEASVRRVWTEEVTPKVERVHLEIELGPQSRVDGLLLRGSDPLGLLGEERIALQPGMPLDRSAIDLGASRLRAEYVADGYTDAEVRIRPSQRETGEWDLEVAITPGRKRTVAVVTVAGLRHTREQVLRRGLVVQPGEILLPGDLDSSAAQMAAFAPIRRVTAWTRPSGPDATRVEIDVQEKQRWTVEVGAGWSSDRGPDARVGVRDDNLLGRGFGLSLRARWQADERLAFLYASLPPLPGRKISLLANVGYFEGDSREDPTTLSERRTSSAIESTYLIGGRTSLRGYYRLTETVLDVKDPADPLAGFFPTTEMEAVLGTQLIRDALDNPFDPRSGSYAALDVSTNVPELGGDLADIRAVLTGSLALEPAARWTWAQSLRLGWADGRQGQNLTVNRRFFAGGQASIRGFDRDSVGPVKLGLYADPVPAGGGALLILNEELRVPVWNGLRLAVFADVGQVWESWSDADLELAVGAGVGFRWSTPIGPVWGDVAWPVANSGISSTKPKFYLGIGRPF